LPVKPERSPKGADRNKTAAGSFGGDPTETQRVYGPQSQANESTFGTAESVFDTRLEEMQALAHIFADVYLEQWDRENSRFKSQAGTNASPLVH